MDTDLVIIGGGMAGLTAGIYAAWNKLDAVLIERMGTGGQIMNADRVENFPGFPEGIAGYDLAARVGEQAMNLGLRIDYGEVQALKSEAGRHVVVTDGGEFRTRAVILAAGSVLAKLGVPGEEEFEGRGISSCAVCDAEFFRDQPVVVVGGGDSAFDEACYLAGVASSVTMLIRDEQPDAVAALVERAREKPNISYRYGSVVEAIEGDDGVERVRVRTGEQQETIEANGVFVYVGLTPNLERFRDMLPRDEDGHVSVDAWMRTVVPGVFAAGDLRGQSARQLVTVAGDGATAAIAAARYLKTGEWRTPTAGG